MYEEKKSSGASKIIIAVCVIVALAAIGVGAKFLIEHINGKPAVSAEQGCSNKDGMDTLNKAGVFGEDGDNCEEESGE